MSVTTLTKEDILNVFRQHRESFRQLGVRRLGLFGSYVRREQHVGSDVDVVVEFDPAEKTFDHFVDLAERLEELLGRPVELVTQESLSPYLGPSIRQEAEYVEVTD